MASGLKLKPSQDWHRLKKLQKEGLRREKGLGSPLGNGPPCISSMDWFQREQRWNYNRQALETHVPGIFTNSFFSKLPLLGGRREGVVRELVFEKRFVSYSQIYWPKVAIKKFGRYACSSPEDQARTLHSLHRLKEFWGACGEWPTEVKIPEVITYQYPFLVMRSLHGNGYYKMYEISPELRREIRNKLIGIGRLITCSEARLVKRFKSAGLQYPNPDFTPSNTIAQLKNGAITAIWIFDQFSVPGKPTDERRVQRKSLLRTSQNERWNLTG